MYDKYDLGLKMGKEQSRLEAHTNMNKTTEMYAQLLDELIDIAYDIQENKRLETFHLEKFETGMRQSWEYVFFHWSGKLVAYLTHDFFEAEELLLKLWKDKSVKVRQNVVLTLYAKPSMHVIDTIIKKGINDKGKYIRSTISGFICSGDYKQYLPILEERIQIEKDDFVRETLTKSISFLTKGYYIRKDENNMCFLYIKTERGEKGLYIHEDDIEKFIFKELHST